MAKFENLIAKLKGDIKVSNELVEKAEEMVKLHDEFDEMGFYEEDLTNEQLLQVRQLLDILNENALKLVEIIGVED